MALSMTSPAARLRSALPILLVVVAAAVALVWGRPHGPDAAIDDALHAYATTLARGDLEEAWRNHTTQAYRRRTPEVVFLAAQARNRDELGALTAIVTSRQRPETTPDEDGVLVTRVFAGWQGDRSTATVAFDLVQEAGVWRIHRSWSWPAQAPAYERTW